MPDHAEFAAPAPEVRSSTSTDGTRRIELTGAWNLQGIEHRFEELRPPLIEYAADPRAQWDLNGITVLDHAGAMLLWRAWGRRRAPNLSLKTEHEPVFSRLDLGREPGTPPPRRDPLFVVAYLGARMLALLDHLATIFIVLGQVMIDAAYLAGRPARIPWREI